MVTRDKKEFVQTVSQEISQLVLEKVNQVKRDGKYETKYGSMAHRLPALVRRSGLVQALTFVEAKGQKVKAWEQLLNDLADTLNFTSGKKLREAAQKAPLDEYMQMTQAVNLRLLWFKRFAESMLDIDQSQQMNDAEEDDD